MPELRKVLQVEDEADIQEISKMSLESLGGFDLLQCLSGEEAIAKAAAFDPDIILLDVMMPGMDGLETLEHLRRIEGFATKPVVFMTAKASQKSVVSLHELDVADVITKPFDPLTLPDTVREIWDRWQS